MKTLIIILLLIISTISFAHQIARGIKDAAIKQWGKCGVTSGWFAINTDNQVVKEVKIYTLEEKLLFNNIPKASNPVINIRNLVKGTYILLMVFENGKEEKSTFL